jgi:DNA topoisomerase-3
MIFSKRNGLSPYNKIYEFEADVFNKRSLMIMTSVSGHLLSLEFPSQYRGWKSIQPIELFSAPVYKNCSADYEPIKKTIEREAKQCTKLIIWTDCDREGENIGYEIIEVCKSVKPNIDVYRAVFSEITGSAIRRALNNLQRPNSFINDAVNARIELDLRIGILLFKKS